eukprot:3171106-Lingulodinium_polyedra.AAC.1
MQPIHLELAPIKNISIFCCNLSGGRDGRPRGRGRCFAAAEICLEYQPGEREAAFLASAPAFA